MTQTRILFRLSAALAALIICFGPANARDLTFDERVQAQKAIEEVYWRHRIWPTENLTRKPALNEVMPESALRAKVEDYLKKSNALEQVWGHALTAAELQAEIVRMATRTRASEMLSEIFQALGNDPALIAETLARQSLADRFVRHRYARDRRFHDAVRARAESALSAHKTILELKGGDSTFCQKTWRLSTDATDAVTRASDDNASTLNPREWARLMDQLASDVATAERFGAGTSSRIGSVSLSKGLLSRLREQDDVFYATEILAADTNTVTTATVSWRKQPFDDWWAVRRRALATAIAAPTGSFSLVTPKDSTCTADTWSPIDSDTPEPREYHTAVWTGSEMIVWGGYQNGDETSTGSRYTPATDTWISTPTGGDTPSGRYQHAAVWTGTEMVIWGGKNAIGYNTNTGGRYDPSTNVWRPTSLAGAPLERLHPSIFWTGSKVLIWGGDGCTPGCTSKRTGGLYDPLTDSWSPTNLTGAPVGRYEYSAVWTGTSMIVWGGHTGSPSSPVRTGGRYYPASDSWVATSTGTNVPAARYGHTAVWTGTEMIVWGGTNGAYLATGGRYNPITDTWVPTSTGANVPSGRVSETSVWDGQRMIIWGGRGSNTTNTGARYDPSQDVWTPTSTGAGAAEPRYHHTAVWTGDEMIVWGGYIDYGFDGGLTATGARYDPSTDSWLATGMGSTPIVRVFHTAVWTGTEMIVWGGATYYSALNDGSRYDPITDSWSPTSLGPFVPDARAEHTSVWAGTEMIVWGGSSDVNYRNTGGRYNPITNTWRETNLSSTTPIARRLHTAVWSGREMIVWGGVPDPDVSALTIRRAERYDPDSDTWTNSTAGSTAPTYRVGHTAVFANGRMIVWGGSDDGSMNTGGRYDPSTDTWLPTSVGPGVPQGRLSHSAVAANGKMIIWGGAYGYKNTGGVYDPVADAWTPTSETLGEVPAGRFDHAAVWTGTKMIVWGGYGGNWPDVSELNSGGIYDVTSDSWTATSLGTNAPTPRRWPAAVWTGTEMIIWGGGEPTTASGARYCACPSGRLVYRDADGDRYGDPAVAAPSCDGAAPAGYVLDHTDCDDANSAVHPGAAEECNGIDSDCNGIVSDGGSASCDDGNACTVDACTNGVCTWLSVCDDGLPCTDDLGDVSNNCACTHTVSSPGTVCDDRNACTVGTTCDGAGGTAAECTGGAALNCDDGNPCTDDSCDPAGGCVHGNNMNACDDHNACTAGDTCGGGSCNSGLAVSCDDNNPCNDDSCVPSIGCIHTVNVARCDDGNSCTDDSCDPALGCAHTNNAAPCNDGNACTPIDTCAGGTCNGGLAPNCNDGNPCTSDSCNPQTGCVHANNTIACDDGNVCTTGDRCGSGTCNAAASMNCDDGNPCTDDSCDALNGCQSLNNTGDCYDGSLCTVNDTCAGGTCHGGPLVVCNDVNPCTTDTCFPNMGCVSSANADPCDDGNACTVGDACGGGFCQSGTAINAPPETQNLMVAADKVTSSWSSATGATRYDVVRGGTGSFPVGPGGNDEVCFGNLLGTTLLDTAIPAPGAGFWYLSRAENACGSGTFGRQSDGSLRTTSTCP